MVDKSTARWDGGSDYDDADGADPRQKMMAILVGVLAVVFAGVLFFVYGPKGDSKPKPSRDPKKPTTTVTQMPTVWTSPDPYPESLRDPMYYAFPSDEPDDPTPPVIGTPQPDDPEPDETEPIVETPTYPDFEVTAIMRSTSGNMAMVNGYLVGEGDSIGETRVVSIGADQVTFEMDGVRWIKELIQN